MKYILLTEKPWHKKLFANLSLREGEEWLWIQKREDLTLSNVSEFNPGKIFVPHWSYIIPVEIYEKFETIVFHMTDLPYGRGGSPLQNLIVRGHTETMISAIRVDEGIDTGPVYLKKPLILCGTAEEIFLKAAQIIEEMVVEIIPGNLTPIPQQGEPVNFKRRKPGESDLSGLSELRQVYDHIRMLDAEGYPKAFLETPHFRFEFSRATLRNDESIIADVRIIKK